MARCALIAGLLILTNCSEDRKSGEAPPQKADYSPAPAPAPMPQASSTWTTGAIGGEAAAVFLSAAREPLFSIVCGGEIGIVLQRHLQAGPRSTAQMELRVDGEMRALDVRTVEANPAVLRAILPYKDSFTANISEMDAPVAIAGAGAPALVLPPNRMVGEFIRDCPR